MMINHADKSCRQYAIMGKSGINTVGDFIFEKPEELKRVRNLGRK